MKTSLLVFGGAFALVVGAIHAACTFPDVAYRPTGAGEGGPGDAGDSGAVIVEDAGSRVDAAGCTVCDCDHDGFNDLMKASCAGAGGLNDCDDTDTTARPNQGFNTNAPHPPQNGDWDCKNGVEKFYKSNVTCTGPGGADCDGRFGFEDDPACGAPGTYVTCKTIEATPPLLPGKCIQASRDLNAKTQACK